LALVVAVAYVHRLDEASAVVEDNLHLDYNLVDMVHILAVASYFENYHIPVVAKENILLAEGYYNFEHNERNYAVCEYVAEASNLLKVVAVAVENIQLAQFVFDYP
jgi:hypothetical protein